LDTENLNPNPAVWKIVNPNQKEGKVWQITIVPNI
jgi:hypothetical protein